MAENVTIARPYAEAAFSLAKGMGALDSWSEVLQRMAAIAANSQMKDCYSNPNVPKNQLVALLTGVLGGTLSPEQQNFIQVLVDNHRLEVLPEIRDLFIALKNEHEGVKTAEVASAFALDDAARARLKQDLEARFGCRLDVHVSVDPTLIGGVKVSVGDEVIDTSVRGKLASMAAALMN